MTWQQVVAVQTQADLKVEIDGGDAVPVENASWGDRPTYELEKKNGDTYEFVSYDPGMAEFDRRHDKPGGARDVINANVVMAKDIAEALSDGKEVWVDVHFGDEHSYVKYWADGAPWEAGEIYDEYGIQAVSR